MKKDITVKNGSISYYTIGRGQPLIMLCGYGGSYANWPHELINELGKNFEVYCLNYRGIGFSKSNDNNYTIPLLAEDLHQFIQELKLTNISLFSFSMGGYVAQEYVLHYKEKINLLILCATKIGGQKAFAVDPEILQKMLPQNSSAEEELESDLKLNFPLDEIGKYRESQKERYKIRNLPESLVSPEVRIKQRDAIGLWIKNFSGEKYAEYAKMNIQNTLLFSGLKDIIIDYQNSIILSQHIKNSQIHIFDNGGHGLLRQHPVEIGKIIVNKGT